MLEFAIGLICGGVATLVYAYRRARRRVAPSRRLPSKT